MAEPEADRPPAGSPEADAPARTEEIRWAGWRWIEATRIRFVDGRCVLEPIKLRLWY